MLDLAARRVVRCSGSVVDLSATLEVGYMPGIDWPKLLVLTLIVMVTSLVVFGYLMQKQANRNGSMDNSVWFLIILLAIAILSIGSFITFIFMRGFAG